MKVFVLFLLLVSYMHSLLFQLSHKGSLALDGKAATPASVSSTDASFQQGPSDTTASQEPKHKEEEDDEDDMMGGKMLKQEDIKTEKKLEVGSLKMFYVKMLFSMLFIKHPISVFYFFIH